MVLSPPLPVQTGNHFTKMGIQLALEVAVRPRKVMLICLRGTIGGYYFLKGILGGHLLRVTLSQGQWISLIQLMVVKKLQDRLQKAKKVHWVLLVLVNRFSTCRAIPSPLKQAKQWLALFRRVTPLQDSQWRWGWGY